MPCKANARNVNLIFCHLFTWRKVYLSTENSCHLAQSNKPEVILNAMLADLQFCTQCLEFSSHICYTDLTFPLIYIY